MANPLGYLAYHTSRQRLRSFSINHFGQVATLHKVHHYALLVSILVYELFLEAHNVRTDITVRVQGDFLINRGHFTISV